METDNKYTGVFLGNNTVSSELTLKKALLFYDEIHFVDNPSIKFDDFENFDMHRICRPGTESPLNVFNTNPEILQNEISIICHKIKPFENVVEKAVFKSIEEDMNDLNFKKIFIHEFLNNPIFINVLCLVPLGIMHTTVEHITFQPIQFDINMLNAMRKINWEEVPFNFANLYNIDSRCLFHYENVESMTHTMEWFLGVASYLLNNAILNTINIDAVSFTDIDSFYKLLAVKFNRCKEKNELSNNTKVVRIADNVMGKILGSDSLKYISLADIIKYRQENKEKLLEFRQYLSKIQYQLEKEVFDEGFEKEVEKLYSMEIEPRKKEIEEALVRSWEDLCGTIIKKVTAPITPAAVAAIYFKGLSFEQIAFGIGGLAVLSVPAITDYVIKKRRINRSNSLAYLFGL